MILRAGGLRCARMDTHPIPGFVSLRTPARLLRHARGNSGCGGLKHLHLAHQGKPPHREPTTPQPSPISPPSRPPYSSYSPELSTVLRLPYHPRFTLVEPWCPSRTSSRTPHPFPATPSTTSPHLFNTPPRVSVYLELPIMRLDVKVCNGLQLSHPRTTGADRSIETTVRPVRPSQGH